MPNKAACRVLCTHVSNNNFNPSERAAFESANSESLVCATLICYARREKI